MSEQNKAVVRRLVDEVMNAGRLDVVDEIYMPRMAAAARAWIAPFRASFPDVHMQVVDLVADGDKVAGRFLCSGTQRSAWQGHPANGQRFERVAEVYFFELHEGRITRAWGLEDNLTRMRQLGQLGPAREASDGEAVPPPAVAILKSADIAVTLDWYRGVGFAVRRRELTFGEVAREGLVLQFLSGETPWTSPPRLTGCFYVHVSDVDAVAEKLRGRVDAPWGVEDRAWGGRELVVQDPDGYYITFTAPRT